MVKVVLPLSAKNLSEDFIKINYNKLIFPQSLLNNTGGVFGTRVKLSYGLTMESWACEMVDIVCFRLGYSLVVHY
jgi:hypothetical protein